MWIPFELQRGVGGPNRKPFYAAWASFVRMAFTSGGTLYFMANVAGSPVAVYLCKLDSSVHRLMLGI